MAREALRESVVRLVRLVRHVRHVRHDQGPNHELILHDAITAEHPCSPGPLLRATHSSTTST
ncbi:MAG TPA: hypothetical protein VIK32_13640, partial [Candidatus Limnocylindrales bacterium]